MIFIIFINNVYLYSLNIIFNIRGKRDNFVIDMCIFYIGFIIICL
jgi:hypothetical protein